MIEELQRQLTMEAKKQADKVICYKLSQIKERTNIRQGLRTLLDEIIHANSIEEIEKAKENMEAGGYKIHVEMPETEYFEKDGQFKAVIDYGKIKVTLTKTVVLGEA